MSGYQAPQMKNSSTIITNSLLRLGEGMGVRADDSISGTVRRVVSLVPAAALLASAWVAAQAAEPGQRTFETRCASCHGADGNGGEMGPPIAARLGGRDDEQPAARIRPGGPEGG